MRAPASSANLGPGFDVLAAALGLWLELDVEDTGAFGVESDLAGVPLDRTNLCVRAFEALHPAEGLHFSIRSQIPPGAGLGSSAAAIVAGLVAAARLTEAAADPAAPMAEVAPGPARVFSRAAALEGHPDNVAAALLGGFVVAVDGEPVRLDPPDGLAAVLATPPDRVPTTAARAALPALVPMADAVHNVGHTALLALGLQSGRLDLVARGLSDRLHQERRTALYPRAMELRALHGELGAVGATISGAGPTVLFWCAAAAAAGVAEELARRAPDCRVREVPFAAAGALAGSGRATP